MLATTLAKLIYINIIQCTTLVHSHALLWCIVGASPRVMSGYVVPAHASMT